MGLVRLRKRGWNGNELDSYGTPQKHCVRCNRFTRFLDVDRLERNIQTPISSTLLSSRKRSRAYDESDIAPVHLESAVAASTTNSKTCVWGTKGTAWIHWRPSYIHPAFRSTAACCATITIIASTTYLRHDQIDCSNEGKAKESERKAYTGKK
jgi:hypothetical protein